MKFDSKVFFALCVVGSVILTGCNGIGSKDTLLAKFDNEAVYQEDLEMLLKNNANSKEPLNYMVYENLYSKAAIASKALSEFPEIKKEWEDYFKEINPRILMVVFQRFYAMELLTFSDSELRRFYTGNKQLFPNDTVGDYRKVRSEVAGAYYLYKNPEKFAAHLKENLGDSAATVTAEDSAKYRADFLEKYRGYLRDSIGSNIMNLQKISMQEPPTADAKAYYEKHHDEFMTAGGYELYQIQMSDSAALSNLFAETPTFEQFKALAFANDQNKVTAKDSGRVGVVKNYHCLPYEIGMMDSLFTVLEGKNAGFVTGVFKSVASKSFHRFYLVSKVKPELKPFERVEKGLVSAIASGQILDVDSSFALILNDGKVVFTEADLMRFNDKYNKRKMNSSSHQRMTRMMAETFAYAEAAKALKLDRTWEYRSLVRTTRLDFIFDKYFEYVHKSIEVPEDTLKSLYERIGNPIHEGYDYEKAKEDLKEIARFPKNIYKHSYYLGYRFFYGDKTLDQSLAPIYYKSNEEYRIHYTKRLTAEAYSQATIHLYDTSIPEYKPEMLLDDLLRRADSLYKAGNRSAAYYEYRKVRIAYADNDSIFQKVAYEMCQIQNENEEYQDAEADYYAFYKMWPENPDAEKAMFSRGFLLTENLHRNKAALAVLKEFQQTYPNSELKESVDWLVQNIESDGKLAEDLLKKISAEE